MISGNAAKGWTRRSRWVSAASLGTGGESNICAPEESGATALLAGLSENSSIEWTTG
jgi:hypothetical protein